MEVAFETRLFINSEGIELNEFAHQYVTKIVLCAVSMLKGGEKVNSLVFTLDGSRTGLVINNISVPLSPFPRDALRGTFSGMASSLRGVNEINSLKIELKQGKAPD
jgi:hypothetical protein